MPPAHKVGIGRSRNRFSDARRPGPISGALAALRGGGLLVNRKRVRRLMRVMGLEAIYQKPNTSRPHPDHKAYPYLLRKRRGAPTWYPP